MGITCEVEVGPSRDVLLAERAERALLQQPRVDALAVVLVPARQYLDHLAWLELLQALAAGKRGGRGVQTHACRMMMATPRTPALRGPG